MEGTDIGEKESQVWNEVIILSGLSQWLSGKESTCTSGNVEMWVHPWIRKLPWRRKWQPTPVFLPGGSHGHRSLGGYIP